VRCSMPHANLRRGAEIEHTCGVCAAPRGMWGGRGLPIGGSMRGGIKGPFDLVQKAGPSRVGPAAGALHRLLGLDSLGGRAVRADYSRAK
jgi:hypothetical protein